MLEVHGLHAGERRNAHRHRVQGSEAGCVNKRTILAGWPKLDPLFLITAGDVGMEHGVRRLHVQSAADGHQGHDKGADERAINQGGSAGFGDECRPLKAVLSHPADESKNPREQVQDRHTPGEYTQFAEPEGARPDQRHEIANVKPGAQDRQADEYLSRPRAEDRSVVARASPCEPANPFTHAEV